LSSISGGSAADHLALDGGPQGVVVHRLVVLGGNDHRVDPYHLVPVVLHAHLALAVRAQPIEGAVLPDLRQAPGEGVGVLDRSRHEFGRLPAGIAEHQPLIPGAARVHAHGDIRALLVEGDHDRAGIAVEALAAVVVADCVHHAAHQLGHGDVGLRGDFPGHDHQAGGDQGFAGHAAGGVVLEGRVQNRVADLVRDFVRVTLGHAFGGEQVGAVLGHA
jgi:hypothetical protein